MAVQSQINAVAARSLAGLRAIAHRDRRTGVCVGRRVSTTRSTRPMAGRLDEAEALATANLDLGMQIAAPDAFTFFAGQVFVIGSLAGVTKSCSSRRTGRAR